MLWNVVWSEVASASFPVQQRYDPMIMYLPRISRVAAIDGGMLLLLVPVWAMMSCLAILSNCQRLSGGWFSVSRGGLNRSTCSNC